MNEARGAPGPKPLAPGRTMRDQVRDQDCVEFLQSQLPCLELRWAGYRKVRRTVCKRLRRRLRELGLESLAAYAAVLAQDPGERRRFESFCRIPISRFYRDREVFETIARRVLPDLAQRAALRGDRRVRCWSAGCASGEEPYSVRIAFSQHAAPAHPGVQIRILATDAEPAMLRRAAEACYGQGSLKDLPPGVRDQAFFRHNGRYALCADFKDGVHFLEHDVRTPMPGAPFDLILCRNLAFTYFDAALQVRVLSHLDDHLQPGGYLIIGSHERLPEETEGFVCRNGSLPIFRKVA